MVLVWRWHQARLVVSGMTSHARTNMPSSVRNPDPTSAHPPKPRLLLHQRTVLKAGRPCLTSNTVTRYMRQWIKQLKPLLYAGAMRSVVIFPVLTFGLVCCSSSTMWTGPRGRAGEKHMRTVWTEEVTWSASTVRWRKISWPRTAKAAASGSASSTTRQREVSQMCVL